MKITESKLSGKQRLLFVKQEAEAAIKQAQLATAEALAKYQTVIAALQDTKNKALEPYITKLEAATEAYYYALDEPDSCTACLQPTSCYD